MGETQQDLTDQEWHDQQQRERAEAAELHREKTAGTSESQAEQSDEQPTPEPEEAQPELPSEESPSELQTEQPDQPIETPPTVESQEPRVDGAPDLSQPEETGDEQDGSEE